LLDGKISDADDTQRNWRPVCERYAEYMQEQWALDELEEEEARTEASRVAAVEKVEAERQLQRAKKRQQAEERKRAKMAMASEQVTRVDEMYPGMNTPLLGAGNVNNGIFTVPSPSPLRCSTAYEDAAMAPQEPPLVSNVNEEAIQQNVFIFAPQQDLDASSTILHVKQES